MSSYDYDALLTEAGEPTDKYYQVQKAIKEACPEVWQAKPRTKQLAALGTFPIENSVSLLAIKDQLMAPQENMYPLTMEATSTGYGYLLYSVQLKNYHRENKLKVVEASDRLHIFTDGQLQAIQYQETLGEELLIQGAPDKETIELDVLVENLGRVNYGFKLNGPTQAKGIRGGIMQDIHFHQGYRHYPLTLSAEQLQAIDYQAGKKSDTPLLLSNDLHADRGRRYVHRLPWVWQRRRYRQRHQSWSLLATWPRAFLILSERIFEKRQQRSRGI